MTLDPILAAPLAVQIHLVFAVAALVLSPVMLLRRKGDRLHKTLGRVWAVAMGVTALSSFWITETRLIGPYSPIHILSVVTLVSLWNAVRAARARRIAAHKISIYGALAGTVGAFGFTFLPGRLMSRTFFGGMEWEGFATLVTLCVVAAVWLALQGRAARRGTRA